MSKYTSKLAGKNVIVFGGTSGIGFAVAEAAVEHGAHVIISGSKPDRLAGAVEKLQGTYPDFKSNVSGITCDLANLDQLEENVKAFFAEASSSFPGSKTTTTATTNEQPTKIDHIAFTAGDAFSFLALKDIDVAYIHRAGTVRFVAPVMIAKHASPYLLHSPSSSITLTGGSNSQKPGVNWAVLAGWGSAVEGLTRGLAKDLAPVRVNLVAPGAVHTELFDKIPYEKRDDVLEGYRKTTLTAQLGRPEDVAEAYLYAMKDQFITGAVIHSDGGRFLT